MACAQSLSVQPATGKAATMRNARMTRQGREKLRLTSTPCYATSESGANRSGNGCLQNFYATVRATALAVRIQFRQDRSSFPFSVSGAPACTGPSELNAFIDARTVPAGTVLEPDLAIVG